MSHADAHGARVLHGAIWAIHAPATPCRVAARAGRVFSMTASPPLCSIPFVDDRVPTGDHGVPPGKWAVKIGFVVKVCGGFKGLFSDRTPTIFLFSDAFCVSFYYFCTAEPPDFGRLVVQIT